MTREEEIRQASQKYSVATDSGSVDDPKKRSCDFIAGAVWADCHQRSHWHSVADGDDPKEPNGSAEDLPFVVITKYGDTFMSYYEDGKFFDDCGRELDVLYWIEIPKLPNGK